MSYSDEEKKKYMAALVEKVGSESVLLAARLRLADGLRELRQLQVLVSDATPDQALAKGPTPPVIRTYVLAMITELAELSETMVGKAWAGDVPESRDRILDEFADVTAFYGVLAEFVFQATNASATEVAQAYLTKVGRNLERAAGREEGYEINARMERSLMNGWVSED
jgi:hypothetical protein